MRLPTRREWRWVAAGVAGWAALGLFVGLLSGHAGDRESPRVGSGPVTHQTRRESAEASPKATKTTESFIAGYPTGDAGCLAALMSQYRREYHQPRAGENPYWMHSCVNTADTERDRLAGLAVMLGENAPLDEAAQLDDLTLTAHDRTVYDMAEIILSNEAKYEKGLK